MRWSIKKHFFAIAKKLKYFFQNKEATSLSTSKKQSEAVKMNTIKTATLSNVEPVCVDGEGTQHSYVPRTIRTARDAYAASLHIIFSHVADFHAVVITIIAEKYGIPEEEIFETVRADPRFGSLVADPVVQSMSYFDEDDLSNAMKKMKMDEVAVSGVAAAHVAMEPIAPLTAAPAAKKPAKRVLKKTKVISLADE